MPKYNDNDFLNGLTYKRLKYLERKQRRFFFNIEIEPDTKKSMPGAAKDEIQRQLLKALLEQRRRAYRAPIALQVRMATSKRTPSHLHNIAKNLLDLFGKPRNGLQTGRSALLYSDDSQIEALSVTCQHDGEEGRPDITVVASPMRDVIENIKLVAPNDRRKRDEDRFERTMERDRGFEHFLDVLDNHDEMRKQLGDASANAMLHMARLSAQEVIFSDAALRPCDISDAFNADEVEGRFGFEGMWERTFSLSPLRIKLDELPNEPGASALYRGKVEEAIRAFKSSYGRLITPLSVPVAIEVLVKPCHPARQRGLHDLDNVFRDYLIPGLTEILKPISHFSFAYDHCAFGDEPKIQRLQRPPASTRYGVTRYEVWRLPPAKENEKGFLSVAVVCDMTGFDGVFEKLDQELSEWEDAS